MRAQDVHRDKRGSHWKFLANRSRWIRIIELMILVVVESLAALPSLTRSPVPIFDSVAYMAPVSLVGGRLPLAPLTFSLLGHNLKAIAVAQTLLSVAAWSYLAIEALRITRRPYCYLAFGLVLLFSSSGYVTQWNTAILSDSISLSLLVFLLASIASHLDGRGSRWRIVLLAIAWAFTRDTNGFELFVVASVLLVLLVVTRNRQLAPFAFAGILFATGVVVIWLSSRGVMNTDPLNHVMFDRVLTNPAMTSFFHAHGMPEPSGILKLGQAHQPSQVSELFGDPHFASWQRWVTLRGKQTYILWALSHPIWVLAGTFGSHPVRWGGRLTGYDELNWSTLTFYGGAVQHQILWQPLRSVFVAGRQSTLVALGLLVATIMIVRRRFLSSVARQLRTWGAIAGLGVLFLMFVWVGDSWEIGRHLIGPTVQVAIALALMAAVALGATGPRQSEQTQIDPELNEVIESGQEQY